MLDKIFSPGFFDANGEVGHDVNGLWERIEQIAGGGGPEGLAIGSRGHEYRNSSIRSGQSVKSAEGLWQESPAPRIRSKTLNRMMRFHCREGAAKHTFEATQGLSTRIVILDLG